MSLPTAEQNGVFTHVYPITDLGMDTSLADTETSTGTNFSTGIPATVLVVCSLTTGAGNLKIDVNGGTADFNSPDKTLTLSGTGRLVEWVNTSLTYDDSDVHTTTISSNLLYVGLKATAANAAGLVFNEFAVFVLYELTPGEDWFLGLRASANAVANRTVGDGSGVVTMTPTQPTYTVVL